MLTTDKREAELENVNLRYQKHGDERVPAVDMKFSFNISSADLDGAVPGMKETLYRKPKKGDGKMLGDQMQLDGGAAAWTVLRHTDLEPVRIKGKFPGYELELLLPHEIDAEDAEPAGFVDVELKKLSFDAQEGGTVIVTVTASMKIDDDETADITAFLRNGDVLLTLTPPAQKPEVASDATPKESTADAAAKAIAADESQQALH